MTIDRKILGGYAIVLALLAALTSVAFYSLNRVQATYDRFLDVNVRLVDGANDLRFELRDQIAHYRAILLYPDLQKKYSEDLQADHHQFVEAVEKMRRLVVTDEGLDKVNEIAALQVKNEQAQARVIDLAGRGKRAEALALGVREVLPVTTTMIDKVESFRERQLKIVADGRAELAATVNRFMLTMAIVSFLGLAAGISIGFYLSRAITRQLRESVAQLSSAASEIVASTTQLASSASESAAAVSETTTTVEEVRQTAQVASQKAKLVSDSAQKAAQSSQNGRKSTEDVAAGMNRIRQQMDAIAASMGRLSEQSQTIGQIIATVEDLAAQSNLLAVNAAIEAAKAGEQGKGFGVVAQEVKSLAEQSRQATNQVRTILGDIQKATATAVLATEQGSKAVEAGTRQTEVAGDSIQALAGSVNEAAQAATQIAASSQQQMVGMDQVALAMDNIKQASVQNVAGTKQAEAAAQNLHELGRKLGAMIGGKAS